ncbi:bacterioferritin-associated ferredoxin [Bdellovibrio bacteriovorus]|uniref:(2Fe-2S)-binding protein n=1 Tax=Bdellovibrio TaxID=958 RepID=UPI0035A8276F
MKIKVELEGRDYIEVECEGDDPKAPGAVKNVSLVGCSAFMEMMQSMRRHFGPDLGKWPLPEGQDHSSLLLKEMILKLRGEWAFPYAHAELCHCRTIATQTVDQAIIAGAHSPEIVTRQTSASTACGTCRPEVQKIIDYRLGKKTA